jgi:hypothetical protein
VCEKLVAKHWVSTGKPEAERQSGTKMLSPTLPSRGIPTNPDADLFLNHESLPDSRIIHRK